MKIAIATEGTSVSSHFGRCSGYTVFKVENNQIEQKKFEISPPHERGIIPRWLNDLEVDVVIAGGAGRNAQMMFEQMGMEFILGISGEIDEVIQKYLNGELSGGESTCDHTGTCNNH